MVFRGGLGRLPAWRSEAHDRPCAALCGRATFVDFESYGHFVDVVLSRKNVRNKRRITAERAQLRPLAKRRPYDYKDTCPAKIGDRSGIFSTGPSDRRQVTG